jgi:hypothetical protein
MVFKKDLSVVGGYGAFELKRLYQRNLALGIVLAVGLHLCSSKRNLILSTSENRATTEDKDSCYY